MDADRHQKFTGVANDLIRNNARVVAGSAISILYRIPLIEDVNDTTHNITEMAQSVRAPGNGATVELLPYHRLGIGKHPTLDKSYLGEVLWNFLKQCNRST